MSILDCESSNPQMVDNPLLKHFVPIKDLTAENRNQMANKSRESTLEMGDTLTPSEEYRWLVYLLDGKIDLYDANKETELVSDDSPRANHPLFMEIQHQSHAVARTQCKIIRFDRQLFSTLLEHEWVTGEELETIEVGEAEGYLFTKIMHAFNTGELKLPSLPEIALKVKSALTNPEVNVVDVSRIIEVDPAMTARLIKVVNSPAVQGMEHVRTIQNAIVRLGLTATKNLVLSFAIKQLFKSRSDMLKKRMRRLYEHSVEIAAISFSVAKITGKFPPENVLLAGLVHDIGVIPILSYIEDTGFEINNEAELENIIKKLRGVVGSMVIKHWGFASEMLSVVEYAEDWHREGSKELDICDIVNIAQIYAMLKNKDVRNMPSFDDVPAFKKIFSGGRDPDFAVKVFDHAEQEISEINKLLRF